VQTLAEAGADVVIASRKLDACEEAAAQVRASTSRQAVAVACHVGRWDDCDRLITESLAPLALHLATAASSYTTGAIIRVDGGLTRQV
jgi:NAD(P)-dependent dehydrogenase (short-subunit alcohol dehydrogenase family)